MRLINVAETDDFPFIIVKFLASTFIGLKLCTAEVRLKMQSTCSERLLSTLALKQLGPFTCSIPVGTRSRDVEASHCCEVLIH